MVAYTLEARIIQKKDQLEELSATGAIIPAPMVEEVRTGQQFLIKIHLTKNDGTIPSRYPALRVGRREAINTAGEARTDPEPLTLEIAVHLAKSGQTRKGACAKCCHKYGPTSPILVLLDPLSPSITDPATYAHVDTTSGSITMLAKVLCSSTDHGERGNKDRYIFEFRLKSTSSMPLAAPIIFPSENNGSPRSSEAPEDEGDTVSSCFTQPIMSSGHHKAKRVYPHQRPIKTLKGTPTPKIKTIKRHKSVPTISMPSRQGTNQAMSSGVECSNSSEYWKDSAGPLSGTHPSNQPGFGSTMFLDESLTQLPDYSHHNSQNPQHIQQLLQQHQQIQQLQLQQQQQLHQNNQHNVRSHSLDTLGQPLLPASSVVYNNNLSAQNTAATTMDATSTHGFQDPSHQQQPHPRIIEVRPNHGPVRKKIDVILRGLAFREGMVPYFGCFPAQDIIIETASLMVCKAPENPLAGTVSISIYDHLGNTFSDLGQFTYTDENESALLMLQLQLRVAHRALEYMHTRATGQRGNAADILREIPGLASSPRTGNMLLSEANENVTDLLADGEVDEDMPLMTLAQIEQNILSTLDNIPRGMDISVQLDDGTNMLHLAVLLGMNYLAARLIEEGCDLEAQDAWSMTPLMYAVLKGNEAIARILIIAGATSSGASTPQEFYARLPRSVEPTQAMYNFLSVSCTRFSGSPHLHALSDSPSVQDSEMSTTDEEEEEWTETSSESLVEFAPALAQNTVTRDFIRVKVELGEIDVATVKAESEMTDVSHVEMEPSVESKISVLHRQLDKSIKQESTEDLAIAIKGVREELSMPPLDQQGLPPFHSVEKDGSVTANNKVVQGADLYGGHDAEIFRNVNPESGYYSGVYSEVQEHLNRLHLTTLPSEGVQMTVNLKRLTPPGPTASSRSQQLSQETGTTVMMSSTTRWELFRTGDTFGVEISLQSTEPETPMPKECLGLRFPHEMVKRVSGKPAVILTEMTYVLRASVELGKSNVPLLTSTSTEQQQQVHDESEDYGDGVQLNGSCTACSKFLHEHKKLSPSRRSLTDPSAYPVLQFSIPGGSSSTNSTTIISSSQSTNNGGVIELRDGKCEIKAKVNCSSMHHLIQRERARRSAELKRRQQENSALPKTATVTTSTAIAAFEGSSIASSTAVTTVKSKKSNSMAMTDLQDPGFVFKFEIVHPINGQVVARCSTKPILFQSYSRGRS
ncbi:hypothetical protein FBU30_003359 [Linnemannia zychae]|nr:hypothetical protein FBU30_003359 [Linnemannia zychae]